MLEDNVTFKYLNNNKILSNIEKKEIIKDIFNNLNRGLLENFIDFNDYYKKIETINKFNEVKKLIKKNY